MPNQSIIAVPPSMESVEKIKIFLQKLVEALDLLLGLRGDNSFIPGPVQRQITIVEETNEALELAVAALTVAVENLSVTVAQLNADLAVEVQERDNLEHYLHGN